MLDVRSVRARFPALARLGEDGRPLVLADAPGGSQVPDTVIEAVAGHYRAGLSNTHGAFITSQETDGLVAEARRAAADLTAPRRTRSSSARIRRLSSSTCPGRSRKRSSAATRSVVTRLDHDANVRPWVMAAADAGATVRWVDVREEDVTIDVDSFAAALSPRTRLVAFTLASNAVGTIPAARDLVARAKDVGALVAVDGVHLAQHRLLDLHGIGADLLVCSPYKFFGPHLGVLAARRSLLESWTPYKVVPAPDDAPDRWETGTQNHEGLAGLIAAVDYLAGLAGTTGAARRDRLAASYGAIAAHERTLAHRFLEGVAAVTGVRLWGIEDRARLDERTPTFAIRVGDQPPAETAKELAARGICVWDGDYYAREIMVRLGLFEAGGAVRVGFCHYHTLDEVDRVLEALAEIS